MKLRDYQERITNKILSNDENVIAVLPTGGGKSVIIREIIKRDTSKTYAVVVRTSALIPQLEARLSSLGINVGVIKDGYDFDDSEDYDAYLIMEQTYKSRHKKIELPDVDVVIKDEFHIGFNGSDFKAIRRTLKPNRVIGLTATPVNERGIGIVTLLPSYELIEEIDTNELIRQGYLVPPVYCFGSSSKMDELLKDVSISNGEYSTSSLDVALNTDSHNNYIASEIADKAKDRNRILVFANSIAHVEALTATLNEKGMNATCTHSKLSKEANDAAMDDYLSGRARILVNMSKLTTGFDDPDTDCIVLVRPTKVDRLYIQIVGRGLRTKEGKVNCLVLDLAGATKENGFAESPRNFRLSSKEDVEREKSNRAEDGISDFDDGSRVTRDRVIEYALANKTQRIDELFNDNQLLNVKNKELVTNNERLLFDSTEQQAEIESLRFALEELKTDYDKLQKSYDEGHKLISKLMNEANTKPTANVNTGGANRANQLTNTYKEARDKSEFLVMLDAANQAMKLKGKPYLTNTQTHKTSSDYMAIRSARTKKKCCTRLNNLLISDEPISNIIDFPSWIRTQDRV